MFSRQSRSRIAARVYSWAVAVSVWYAGIPDLTAGSSADLDAAS